MAAKLGFEHKAKELWLFIASSKMNLRAASLCTENKNPIVILLHDFSSY
jgi:hypothetical protein